MVQLLTPDQVAVSLGIEVKTLYNWHSAGRGPTAIKVGKYLRYREVDVDAYVESLEPRSNVTPIGSRRTA